MPPSLTPITDVRGARVLPAPIDAHQPTAPRTRTIQAVSSPELERVYADAPRDFQPAALLIPRGTILDADGVVAAADGRIVAETFADDAHAERYLAAAPAGGGSTSDAATRQLPGRHAVAMAQWSDNYFHWLIDTLPRLAVLEAVGAEPGLPLVLRGPLQPFQRETLTGLGHPVVELAPGERVTADELLWLGSPAPINFPTAATVEWLRGRMAVPVSAAPHRRLLVTRTHSPRALSNEDAVLAALAPLGFERVAPGEMTIAEQVRVFAEAEVIVGAHGGALTNLAFSRDARVLELFSPRAVYWHYFTLAMAAGHQHWHLLGHARPQLRRAIHRDFTVDPAEVVASVEAMLGD